MIRAGIAGAVMVGSLAFAANAGATTIDTYSFTQTGYVPQVNFDNLTKSVVVTGSFSGTPDSSGNFDLGDLTAFSYTVTQTLGGDTGVSYSTNSLAKLQFFSYEPGISSSLDIIQVDGFHSLCIGAAAAFGYCGRSGDLGTLDGTPFSNFADWYTTSLAQVVLTSSVTTTPTSVTSVTSVTPIAPTLPLFATSLAALGLVRWRTRRAARAAV